MSNRAVVAAEDAAFAARDWGMLAAAALLWGASFLFIAEGLEAFPPPLVALLRLTFGFLVLLAFPAARARVPRSDIPRIALLGLVWMAAPLVLFPVAQQWIDSSLAGILNGAVPLFAALVAALVARALPGRRMALGLLVGFGGVLAVSVPAARGADATALGAGLVLLASAMYGVAINLAVPLQRRHGSLPVIVRAQAVALVLVAPWGLWSVPQATFQWSSLLAMVVLGLGGTGLAFIAMATLAGRVGASRGSVAIYFIPLVAIALGVGFRGEQVTPWTLGGTALVLAGAWLASRAQQPRAAAPVLHAPEAVAAAAR